MHGMSRNLDRPLERPWSRTGLAMAALFIGWCAFAYFAPGALRLYAMQFLFMLPGLAVVSSVVGLLLRAIGLPGNVAVVAGMLAAAVAWTVAAYWLGRFIGDFVDRQPTRGKRVALSLGIVAVLVAPFALFLGAAYGAAWLWEGMQHHGTREDPEEARARTVAEDAKQRAAFERQQAELERVVADARRESDRIDEQHRLGEEQQRRPDAEVLAKVALDRQRADLALARQRAAFDKPAPMAARDSRPLSQDERCLDGQRMKRVENGWVQAGTCG
jgi:hypothetical protein